MYNYQFIVSVTRIKRKINIKVNKNTNESRQRYIIKLNVFIHKMYLFINVFKCIYALMYLDVITH